jgi:hypothetical protein
MRPASATHLILVMRSPCYVFPIHCGPYVACASCGANFTPSLAVHCLFSRALPSKLLGVIFEKTAVLPRADTGAVWGAGEPASEVRSAELQGGTRSALLTCLNVTQPRLTWAGILHANIHMLRNAVLLL